MFVRREADRAIRISQGVRPALGGGAEFFDFPAEDIPVTQDLLLYLRDDAGVVEDSEGRVSTWQDQSGNSHHVSAPSDDAKPRLTGSGLFFDGIDDVLQNLSVPDLDPPFTIFAVAAFRKEPTPTGNERRATILEWETAVNTGVLLFNDALNEGEITARYRDTGGNKSVTGPNLMIGSPRILEFNASESGGSGDLTLKINGELIGTTAWSGVNANSSTELYIGRLKGVSPTYFMKGHIAFIGVYDAEKSTADRDSIRDWLTKKYL